MLRSHCCCFLAAICLLRVRIWQTKAEIWLVWFAIRTVRARFTSDSAGPRACAAPVTRRVENWKYGQLVGCVIYNAERQPIYKVNYGYDRSARLVEERMYSCPQGKLVQRVIYKYDAAGNRSKPLIISLDTSSKQLITPTMKGDENKIYREMGSGKAAGSSR